ncbi:MAG: DUF1302 family protein [bacterium]
MSSYWNPDDFYFSGHLREHGGVNLEDQSEFNDSDNSQFQLNELRTELLLEGRYDWSEEISVKGTLRASREASLPYLEDLEDRGQLSGTTTGAGDLQEFYEEEQFRELFLDYEVSDGISFRAGKQFVSWGKGSFQRALDLVQGFDNSWNPYVTTEEQRRKSLTMLTGNVDVPAGNGNLEFVVYPGLDDVEDIGNTDDLIGGRNAANGLRGFDLTDYPVSSIKSEFGSTVGPLLGDHPDADPEDLQGGIRWSGTLWRNRVEYSLVYLQTHQKEDVNSTRSTLTAGQAAVLNSTAGVPGLYSAGDPTGVSPYKGHHTSKWTERLHPEIQVFGGSANYYSTALGLVFRGEVAYVDDRVFNTLPPAGDMPGKPAGTPYPSAFVKDNLDITSAGVVQKDEVRMMLGMDRQAKFTRRWLSSDRPGFLTLELFDFWIPDHREADRIDLSKDRSEEAKEHSLEAITTLNWSYANRTIKPSVTGLFDLSYGGNTALLPGVEYVISNQWDVKLDGVFLFEAHNDGANIQSYGALGEGDKLVTTVTYQF